MEDLLQVMRRSVRRHYRRIDQRYKRDRVEHEACSCENSLHLKEMIPIIWEHQTRTAAVLMAKGVKTSAVEEFIKRFLVVTLVPDGILDLYYQRIGTTKTLVALQLTIQQGPVLHWFMYFAKETASKSGIWFHGSLLAILRASNIPSVAYVNAQCHQTETKLHAGFTAAEHTDVTLLSELYPWKWTTSIDESRVNLPLWCDQQYVPPPIIDSS